MVVVVDEGEDDEEDDDEEDDEEEDDDEEEEDDEELLLEEFVVVLVVVVVQAELASVIVVSIVSAASYVQSDSADGPWKPTTVTASREQAPVVTPIENKFPEHIRYPPYIAGSAALLPQLNAPTELVPSE